MHAWLIRRQQDLVLRLQRLLPHLVLTREVQEKVLQHVDCPQCLAPLRTWCRGVSVAQYLHLPRLRAFAEVVVPNLLDDERRAA